MNRYRKLRAQLDQVISDINGCLEKDWSQKQLKRGMEFVIHHEWMPLSQAIVKKYRSAGWIVKLTATVEPGQRLYVLNIKHPEYPTF